MIEQGDILVTGSKSGLGKHCYEIFNGVGFTRETNYDDLIKRAEKKPFRAIIHSAFTSRNEINTAELYHYLNDTILFTKKLLTLPHQKFIYISTADVYPKNDCLHVEDEAISIKDSSNIYGIFKLLSESIIQNEVEDYLIIRPTAMLGRYARSNSLIKMLTKKNPTLTLSALSTFNYILHDDVSDFIKIALDNNLQGIYNIAASDNIQLAQVKEYFNCDAQFGEFTYKTGNISNQKAMTVLKNISNPSLQNILLFLQAIKKV